MKIGHPFQDQFVERNMVPLKFYYDLGRIKFEIKILMILYKLSFQLVMLRHYQWRMDYVGSLL